MPPSPEPDDADGPMVDVVVEREGYEDEVVTVPADANVAGLRAYIVGQLEWGVPTDAMRLTHRGSVDDLVTLQDDEEVVVGASLPHETLRIRASLTEGFLAERWLLERRAPPDLWGVAFETAAASGQSNRPGSDDGAPSPTGAPSDPPPPDGRDWATMAAVLTAINPSNQRAGARNIIIPNTVSVLHAVRGVLYQQIVEGDAATLQRLVDLGVLGGVLSDALCYAMHVYIAASDPHHQASIGVDAATALEMVEIISSCGTEGVFADSEKIMDLALWRKELLTLMLSKDVPANGVTTVLAAAAGRVDTIELLLEHDAPLRVEAAGVVTCTALAAAAQHGHVDVVRALLAANSQDVEVPSNTVGTRSYTLGRPGGNLLRSSPRTSTPLCLAAANADHGTAICRLLLAQGARVNPQGVSRIPLHAALRSGHGETVLLLLRSGADVTAREGVDGTGDTCLFALASSTTARRVRRGMTHEVASTLLTQYRAAELINAERGSDGNNALAAAVRCNDAAVVQLLLDHGADAGWRGHDGATPLFHACAAGADACAGILLRHHDRVTRALHDPDDDRGCCCWPLRRRRRPQGPKKPPRRRAESGVQERTARVAALEAQGDADSARGDEDEEEADVMVHMPRTVPPWRQHATRGRFAPQGVAAAQAQRAYAIRDQPNGVRHLLAQYTKEPDPASERGSQLSPSHRGIGSPRSVASPRSSVRSPRSVARRLSTSPQSPRLPPLLGDGLVLPPAVMPVRSDSAHLTSPAASHKDSAPRPSVALPRTPRPVGPVPAGPLEIDARHSSGLTPLLICCYSGSFALARRLVAHGADVNAAASDGRTALMLLVIGCSGRGCAGMLCADATPDRWELLLLLLRHGADVAAKTEDELTVIDYAYLCLDNRMEVCKELKRAREQQDRRKLEQVERGRFAWFFSSSEEKVQEVDDDVGP